MLGGHAWGDVPVPRSLKKALLKEGVSKKAVDTYFRGPFGRVGIGIILKNVTHKEVKADYSRFLRKETIRKTKKYLAKYQSVFLEIEKAYHVPKEVVASILMVESSFGKNGGKYPVFSVYTSLASLEDRGVQKKVRVQALKAGENIQAPRFKKRMQRKAKWGLKELLCLIRLGERGKIDPFELKGSWAGAFGMPQFIPTSFEAYGVDWDKDGKVNLDSLVDAAASAANYLHQHGWTQNPMKRKRALRVIKFYNLSHPYATTILEMSERLRQ